MQKKRKFTAGEWFIIGCAILAMMACFAIIAMPILDHARKRALSDRGCSTITNVDRNGQPCEWSRARIHQEVIQ